MKFKAQMTKLKREKVLIFSHFDIHLAFACPAFGGDRGLPVGRDFVIWI
jgi:hypothetical protein